LAWDLAISDYGDLIMAGNRDLAGVSGENLTSQRITTRLLVHRGAWFYDTNGTFGSDLYQTLGRSPDEDLEIDARVRDALRDMDDIVIDDIGWTWDSDGKSLIVRVEYSDNPQEDQASLQMASGELNTATTVIIPVITGGGF